MTGALRSRPGIYQAFRAIWQQDFPAVLAQARCPVLAMSAEDDVFIDLLRLDPHAPRRLVTRAVQRFELASLALPLVAVGLLAPLTVHLLVGLLVLGIELQQFSKWIAVSAALVGHAHLVMFGVFGFWILGYMTYMFPRLLGASGWYNPNLNAWHFWLTGIGMLVMFFDLVSGIKSQQYLLLPMT